MKIEAIILSILTIFLFIPVLSFSEPRWQRELEQCGTWSFEPSTSKTNQQDEIAKQNLFWRIDNPDEGTGIGDGSETIESTSVQYRSIHKYYGGRAFFSYPYYIRIKQEDLDAKGEEND